MVSARVAVTRDDRTGAAAATFRSELVLTKHEAFEGCDALADAERLLTESGNTEAATRLVSLFDLLESRLVAL
jgi:hypothetical protein